MEELFQNVLTASFHGSIVIVAVFLLRLALKKTPKKFLCFLWLLAGLRLLMPFEIKSDLSLQPEVEDIPYVTQIRQEEQVSQTMPQPMAPPVIEPVTEVYATPDLVPEGCYDMILEEAVPEEPAEVIPEEPEPDLLSLIPWVWLGVACCFGVYILFSYVTLKLRVRDAIRIKGGWESDRIDTAFILGFIRPKIYIPMGLPLSVRKHILAHERTHLEKGDHWFKMIGFLALAVHWFNPLVWVAYILLCKDIEMACDERVVQFMELEERKSYSAALLCCSTNKVHFAACPVAFGEVSVKERIKTVLSYKKPGFWISLLGVIAIVFVAVCLLTSPVEEPVAPPETPAVTTEAPANTVTVKNVDELLAAIGPDTEILMEAGTYTLSEASGYGQTGSSYYTWREVADGWQLTLIGVENMTLRGSGMHVTILETDPRYAEVVALENCSNVVMEDFTAGHTVNRGECGGGVIWLNGCRDIAMGRLGLYGCGVIGLETNGCTGVTLADSDIYDCSNSAVWLTQSQDVTVSGCRIYRIGDDSYGGYTFFEIYGGSNILIENNQLSDSTLNCLLDVADTEVLLKNNLFTNNRPQSGVFGGGGVCITLDGNRFEGNSIRRWYSWTEICKDKNGKILTEEKLHEMYGTDPEATEPKEPQLEIHVSTVDEFIAAIGPNKDIVLDAQLYDLSTATGYGTSSGDYYFWEDIFDGPGLVIQNVSNMTIRTATGDRNRHTISAVPRYADVLQFKACDNITLSGFTAGHTLEAGSCAGGVLEFHDSDAITVDNCGLFGCGILGVQADFCSDITVRNTEIYECSQGGIQMWEVDGVDLSGVTFRDIGGAYTIYMNSCKDVTVDGQKVVGDQQSGYTESSPEQALVNTLSAVLCDFPQYYLMNDTEGMAQYITADYAAEDWVRADEESYPNILFFDITYEHARTIREEGSLVFEVPFQEWKFDSTGEEEFQYLLVTVVEEDGTFKVSDCVLK